MREAVECPGDSGMSISMREENRKGRAEWRSAETMNW
jgi:hypothetical protein